MKFNQSTRDIDEVISENTFSEPRLVLFITDLSSDDIISQRFIVAEKNLVFKVTNFTIEEGLVSLLAAYYVLHVNYPKSQPAYMMLLFLQEYIMESIDSCAKKPKPLLTLLRKLTPGQKQ